MTNNNTLITDAGLVFTTISQYCCAHGFGNKVAMFPPHPDAPGSNKATFTEIPVDGKPDIHPDVEDILSAMARMAWAVGTEEIATVEKLPLGEGDRCRFIVTVKHERDEARRI